MTTGDAPAFTQLVDLAAERLDGLALAASDEFFAEKENLLKPGRGVFKPDAYTDHGKWMDGWETRRKRHPGHDWCVIRLGLSGRIAGFDIDTNHFLGNHPAEASVDAIAADPTLAPHQLDSVEDQWVRVLQQVPLERGSRNLFAIDDGRRWTHVRLNIYPDGGVARFRVHGHVTPDWDALAPGQRVDLAAIEWGGRGLLANDMFFSSMDNLIMPGTSKSMADGWETRRRRDGGNDWCIFKLGAAGRIESVRVDTHHFKGNFPDRCALDGCYAPDVPGQKLADDPAIWQAILPESRLSAHRSHTFESAIADVGAVTHVRLRIFPDGGVSRLRVYGVPVRD